VASEEKAEEDAASGAMNDATGAEYAIGGGMAIGGISSGVGASRGPLGPTSASTTTAEQVHVAASSAVAIQAVAAAKGSGSGEVALIG
jgi:hypothetical protein